MARYLPLAGIVLFLAVGFAGRAWLQRRRHGHWGIVLFRSKRLDQGLRDVLFIALMVVATGQAAAGAFAPGLLAPLYLVPMRMGLGLVAGGLLLVGGIVLMVIAQLHLGASWRVGIEEGVRPGLVTGGLYRYSRNPIFLGMFVVLAGLVVLQPTWISAAVLAGSLAGVRFQVLEEEIYLSASYGDAYREYAGHVGRFFPGLGRL